MYILLEVLQQYNSSKSKIVDLVVRLRFDLGIKSKTFLLDLLFSTVEY